jgi:formylmethanofuran dehydrogenase subunit E
MIPRSRTQLTTGAHERLSEAADVDMHGQHPRLTKLRQTATGGQTKRSMSAAAHACPADARGAASAMAGTPLAPFVEPLQRLHRVLCPRQVLGVRCALVAAQALNAPFPQSDKRVIALPEIDGCYTDGLLAASGCSVGHRTMRVMDLGKIAVTFFDTRERRAVRVAPRPGVRDNAREYALDVNDRWTVQRDGYARMPDTLLVSCVPVTLTPSLADELLADWQGRIACERCGEEILHAREVVRGGLTLCRACAGEGYLRSC